jgi:hypothetical protein
MKFWTIVIGAIFVFSSIAGTVSGTARYTGSMSGTILIAFLSEGTTSIDPFSMPYTTIMAPGAYSISSDSLYDGPGYYGIAYLGTGVMFPMPASGNPAGMTSEPITLSGGVETGVVIDLTEDGDVGGKITYDGDIRDITVNIWDVFTEFLGGIATLEITENVADTLYSITDVPAGAKRIEAFADINGNGEYDDGEPIGTYASPLGDMAFVGGGSPTATSTDITISASGISEKLPDNNSLDIYPNPFNSACAINYEGVISIYDIQGNLVRELSGKVWDGRDNKGQLLSSGLYLIAAKNSGKTTVKTVVFAK